MIKMILRYGVFAILSLMMIGLTWFANNYEIRTKHPISLVISGQCYKTYIRHIPDLFFQKNDTLVISQTPYGDLPFMIDTIYNEPASIVFLLHPLNEKAFLDAAKGNTYMEGYIFTGKERLRDLVLRKIQIP